LRCLLNNNVTAADLQTICADKFAAADLYQKFANVAAEIPSKKLEDSEVFKSLTDGVTLVRAQHKYGQPFHFVNFAKLIFSANEVPPTRDKTYAFYRRWILIFFHVRFGDCGLPRDVNILEKITTPEELSGILNWALEGLKRLLKQGDFSFRVSVAETEKQYERLSNPIGTFLSDYVEETGNDEDCISKDYLWAELSHYCEKNRLRKPQSKIQLTKEIRIHFENVEQKQRKVGNKERQHVWVNCRFSDALTKLDYASWVEELT
jgi:putative DNA primase/helicase